MKPTMDDVQVVLAQFDDSDWDELRIDTDEFHLHVFRSPRGDRPERVATAPVVGHEPVAHASPAPLAAVTRLPGAASAPAAPSAAAGSGATRDGVIVRAPSLGTFYRSPKPGAPAFVEVGSEVSPTTQVCLLEVMKLYTAVEAGISGVVAEILVDDGGLVEYDQPLLVIQPQDD